MKDKKMGEKTIKIACKTDSSLRIDQFIPFHGQLKVRDQEHIKALADSIIRHGFSYPLFVWNNADKNFLLDGHGRILALTYLRSMGYSIPPIPVVYVKAKDVVEARQKVLELNNLNGRIDKEAFVKYAQTLNMDFSNIRVIGLDLSDVMDRLSTFAEDAGSLGKTHTCPYCGEEFTEDNSCGQEDS